MWLCWVRKSNPFKWFGESNDRSAKSTYTLSISQRDMTCHQRLISTNLTDAHFPNAALLSPIFITVLYFFSYISYICVSLFWAEMMKIYKSFVAQNELRAKNSWKVWNFCVFAYNLCAICLLRKLEIGNI